MNYPKNKNKQHSAPRFTPIVIALAVSLAYASPCLAQTESVSSDSASSAATLPAVTVNASADASAAGLPTEYAGGQIARGGRVGLLGNQDMMETPLNSTSYTQDLIQNQQARSVSDVLQNDPAVRQARGYGNFQEVYIIRGFPVYSDDIAYNGLYGILPRQYVAAELLERVEVMRGANAFLNGAAPGGSGIGGAINLLPKRAPNEPLTQVTVGIDSGGQGYAAVDLARRFGPDQSTGVRMNVVRRDGGTSTDNEQRELSVAAFGLDFRSRDVRLSADVGYQDHKMDQPRPSVTPSGGIPSAPDASKNFAQSWTYSNERETFGTVRGEYDITDNVTAWAAVGMRHGTETNVLSNPTAYADGTMSSYRYDNVREDSVTTGEIGVRTKLQTGGIRHTVSASASTYKLNSRNAYAFSDFTGFAGNLYNPSSVAAPAANYYVAGSLSDPLTTDITETSSLALADTLSFADDRVLLTLGARRQRIKDTSFNYDTGAQESSYDKTSTTPMAGIVFKASKQISLYANYIEGLIKGEVAPGTVGSVTISNAGQIFAPSRSKQKEIGVKYDGGKFGGSLSAFTTSKPSTMVENGVYSLNGEQRNRGVELTFYGEPERGLRLLGGLTKLDATLRKTTGALYDGNDAIGVPDLMANIGFEKDVPGVRGLTLTGRVVYSSTQYADAANTLEVPAWTRIDIGARYLTQIGNKAVTLCARVDNLANRDYWVSAGGYPGAGYLVLAAARTFTLSATMDF